jgi:predicted thioesterase
MAVGEADTALVVGSGDLPVLSSPSVAALAERACVAAVAPTLPPGSTTVGTRLEHDHLAATPVGVTVTAAAVLESRDTRTHVFSVEVRAQGDVIASVRHTRVVVDRTRFMARAGS